MSEETQTAREEAEALQRLEKLIKEQEAAQHEMYAAKLKEAITGADPKEWNEEQALKQYRDGTEPVDHSKTPSLITRPSETNNVAMRR